MKNQRMGKGFKWFMEENTGFGVRHTEGYTVDDLDTKQLAEAEDSFEKVFVIIRDELEANESRCCDDKGDRLHLCQVLADSLHDKGIFRRSGK